MIGSAPGTLFARAHLLGATHCILTANQCTQGALYINSIRRYERSIDQFNKVTTVQFRMNIFGIFWANLMSIFFFSSALQKRNEKNVLMNNLLRHSVTIPFYFIFLYHFKQYHSNISLYYFYFNVIKKSLWELIAIITAIIAGSSANFYRNIPLWD